MGVEVCRLRAFLQVGVPDPAACCWVPPSPRSVFLRSFCCSPGWAGGVRPRHPPQGPGDLVQRHPPVLQEDQAPHAGDRRPGDPRGAGLWAAGELGGQAGSPSCSLGGHGHVLGLAPRAFSSLPSLLAPQREHSTQPGRALHEPSSSTGMECLWALCSGQGGDVASVSCSPPASSFFLSFLVFSILLLQTRVRHQELAPERGKRAAGCCSVWEGAGGQPPARSP